MKNYLLSKISSLDAKKKWIIGSLKQMEQLELTTVHQALGNGKSLLAAVLSINGSFEKTFNFRSKQPINRGLSSFSSDEINKIKDKQQRN